MKRKLIENIYELSIKKRLMKPNASFDTFYRDCNKMSTSALMHWYKSVLIASGRKR